MATSDELEDCEPSVSQDLNCPLCLKSHISNTASVKGSGKQFCCPICGNVASSGEYSTDKLVHVFPLNTLMLSVLIKSKVKVDLLCNACQAQDVISPAEGLCIIACEEALCAQCSNVHRSPRMSTAHTILKIDDIPSKQETLLQQTNVIFHCKEHAPCPVELYCKNHDTLVCAKCFIDGHTICSRVIKLYKDTPDLLDTLNQMKEQMQKLEGQLKMFIDINVSNLSKLESDVNDLTIENRTLTKRINDALDDLEKRVKEEGNKILNEERSRIA
ncbi:hypothetical protein CHS0354_036235 [Potamilus streckersoni]|uniref:B box-type domain-containing protein n=1 Tax=Potamilus streckersoni TaxID=2493646 RepID=A0AAE0W2D3_9BIVA|nr:hypothetical protein CHS0354_036235 [Potamilus streckersoni]